MESDRWTNKVPGRCCSGVEGVWKVPEVGRCLMVPDRIESHTSLLKLFDSICTPISSVPSPSQFGLLSKHKSWATAYTKSSQKTTNPSSPAPMSVFNPDIPLVLGVIFAASIGVAVLFVITTKLIEQHCSWWLEPSRPHHYIPPPPRLPHPSQNILLDFEHPAVDSDTTITTDAQELQLPAPVHLTYPPQQWRWILCPAISMEGWLYIKKGRRGEGEMCIITIPSFQVIFDHPNRITQHTFHSGLCVIRLFFSLAYVYIVWVIIWLCLFTTCLQPGQWQHWHDIHLCPNCVTTSLGGRSSFMLLSQVDCFPESDSESHLSNIFCRVESLEQQFASKFSLCLVTTIVLFFSPSDVCML